MFSMEGNKGDVDAAKLLSNSFEVSGKGGPPKDRPEGGSTGGKPPFGVKGRRCSLGRGGAVTSAMPKPGGGANPGGGRMPSRSGFKSSLLVVERDEVDTCPTEDGDD